MSANVDVLRLEKKIESLTKAVVELSTLIGKQPTSVSLSSLSHDMKVSRTTLYAHVMNTYEPVVDFDKFKNSIMIKSHVVPLIKEYYERKKK